MANRQPSINFLVAGIQLANREMREPLSRIKSLEQQLSEKDQEIMRVARHNRKLRRRHHELEEQCEHLRQQNQQLIQEHAAEITLLNQQLKQTFAIIQGHGKASILHGMPRKSSAAIQTSRQYLVGKKILSDTQRLRDFLKLPFTLSALVRQYTPAPSLEAVNPVEYDDQKKAGNHSRHLSYRLGCIAVSHARPGLNIKALRLMYTEFKAFKQERHA